MTFEWFIVHIQGSQTSVLYRIYYSLKIIVILVSSADIEEMPQDAEYGSLSVASLFVKL